MDYLQYFKKEEKITVKDAVNRLESNNDIVVSRAHLSRQFAKYEKQKKVTTYALSPVGEKTYYIGHLPNHVAERIKKTVTLKKHIVLTPEYKINLHPKYGLSQREVDAINQVPMTGEFSTNNYKEISEVIDELSYRNVVIKLRSDSASEYFIYEIPTLRQDSNGYHHIDEKLEKTIKTKHLYDFFTATSGKNYETNNFFNYSNTSDNISTSP